MTKLFALAADISRRDFLGGMGALTIGGALLLGSGCSDRPGGAESSDDVLAEALISLFSDRQDAQLLGKLYLAQTAQESSRASLLQAITGIEAADEMPVSDAEQLQAWVQQAVQRDFADDRCVELGGWLLSVTESRLCALTAVAG